MPLAPLVFLFGACLGLAACEELPPPAFDASTSDTSRSDTRETRDGAATEVDGADDATVQCREFVGDIAIATKLDLDQLEFVRVLRGDLLLTPVEGLWNQSVREVTGDVRVTGTAADPVQSHVTLAALSRIGGDLRLDDTVKGLVDIYRLDTLGGSLVAQDGGWAFWTPALRVVSGAIDVRDASHLALTLDQLESLGGPVRIERAAGLVRLSLGRVDKLDSAGAAIRLVGNPDLAVLELGRLTTIGGDVVIRDNPKLTRAEIERALAGIIVTGEMTVCGNADDEACP